MHQTSSTQRLFALIWLTVFFTVGMVGKLFYLQIVRGAYYTELANEQHWSGVEVPATRGEILVRDYRSGEVFPMATNITEYLLYIDPALLIEEELVDQIISQLLPVIYERVDGERLVQRQELQKQLREEAVLRGEEPPEFTADTSTYADRLRSYQGEIRSKISEKKNSRYLPLLDRIPEEKYQEIIDLNLRGLRLLPEHRRYYPENSVGANLIGFVNNEDVGQYGIEGQYDYLLRGKKGYIQAEKDVRGRSIALADSVLDPAINGADMLLTIDRSLQREIEKVVAEAVTEYDADSAQVVVMDPPTGKIISIVNYPTFNPNDFAEVYEREAVGDIERLCQNIEIYNKKIPVVVERDEVDEETGEIERKTTEERCEIIMEEREAYANPRYFIYKNRFGLKVYQNAAASDLYEPGSVFKALAMAVAIDTHQVTPDTRMNETGPIEIDGYTIHNSTHKYGGWTTMTQVLERSSNIGIAFVTKLLGKEIYYRYLRDFGFGERTDVGLDVESPGTLRPWRQWSNVELATIGFGQGISVTPIQMLTAWNTIANGGLLMQPYIIEEIRNSDGTVEKRDPRVIRRVLTQRSAATTAAMLVSVVENGGGKKAQVEGHYLSGKTGTAQIAKGGSWEEGTGTTIASFIGYGPVENPKFSVLVKVDRPRKSPWGSDTAAPLFSKVAEILLDYYDIPPEKK